MAGDGALINREHPPSRQGRRRLAAFGVYQHGREMHLHRYVADFEFRYDNRIALGMDDRGRTTEALKGIKGKRLTYREPAER